MNFILLMYGRFHETGIESGRLNKITANQEVGFSAFIILMFIVPVLKIS